jgi:hypothetical protein
MSFPAGTPVTIGKQDLQTSVNGGGFARSLSRVEWDFDGDGSYEVSDTGPWLTAIGNSTCSGTCPYYTTRETRATYFEATTSFTSIGSHTVRLRVRYSDGSTQSSEGVFSATEDVVSAVLKRASTSDGAGGATGPVLTGRSVYLTASESSSASGKVARYEWDLDGDGTFEIDGGSISTYTTKFSSPGNKSVGVRVTSRGGSTTSATFAIEVRNAPPEGEPGMSILDGAVSTNVKSVKLNLVWPEFATEVRVSNDGGFATSKTQTFQLAPAIDWTLDDSVKGIFTKVVYVRFNGSGIDNTKTYSDDIILDTTPPTIESTSAAASGTSLVISSKAADDITGVDDIQIKSESTMVTQDYSSSVTVSAGDLGLAVSSSSVRKMAGAKLQVRVSDGAGNWSGWKPIEVAGVRPVASSLNSTGGAAGSNSSSVTQFTGKSLKIGSTVRYGDLAAIAKLKVPAKAKISVRIVRSFAKSCRPVGGRLVGLGVGTCRLTVTVAPAKGKALSKSLSLQVIK